MENHKNANGKEPRNAILPYVEFMHVATKHNMDNKKNVKETAKIFFSEKNVMEFLMLSPCRYGRSYPL